MLHHRHGEGRPSLPISFSSPSAPLPEKDGEADITNVKAVARGIAKSINRYKIIINKSTVPIGMGDVVTQIIIKHGPKERVL